LRAVFVGFALLLFAAGIATPVAISLADDGDAPERSSAQLAVLGTSFTYQGRLDGGSGPANGVYNFRFTLHDAVTGGVVVAGPLSADNLNVSGGLFTATVDFGPVAFTGQARWVSVEARADAEQNYTLLTPRQPLSPVPYAIYANAAPWSGVSGIPPEIADGLDNEGADWKLTGNAGTTGANYLGTTDNTPLELRVNGQRALRLEPTDLSTNMIGGSPGNAVTVGVVGATIGGGGANIAGYDNRVTDDWGTIGGGYRNQAGDGANTTQGQSFGTVGGGSGNTALKSFSTVAGGVGNTASGSTGTVGGGYQNTAGGYATVAGGYSNTASGFEAMIPGGGSNVAQGNYSFAAGYRAKSLFNGTFVWADSTDADFAAGGANQFVVRSFGGVQFNVGAAWACAIFNGSNNWGCASDRNLKTNVIDVDGREVLAKLDDVPIQLWTAKDVEDAPPHIGAMAQDFYAAFSLGGDDKVISIGDVGGVALAAIKGLHAITKEQQAEIDALKGGATNFPPNPARGFAGEGSTAAQTPVNPPAATLIRQSVGPSNAALYSVSGAVALFALGLFAVAGALLRRRASIA
jgi:hypothetical protein